MNSQMTFLISLSFQLSLNVPQIICIIMTPVNFRITCHSLFNYFSAWAILDNITDKMFKTQKNVNISSTIFRLNSPRREIFRKIIKKCAEMRLFFKTFSAKTFHDNALKFAEKRWKFVRNVLKCVYFSKSSAQKPYIIMRWNVLKCAGTL